MQIKNPWALSGWMLALAAIPLTVSAGSAPALFPASAERGQVVYGKACAACHGENGDGQGPGAGPLNPKPRDFTSGLYKYRSTGYGSLPTDDDLLRTLNLGIGHSQMPPFRFVLSEQEKRDVVAYIKGFSEDFRDAAPPETLEIPEEIPPSTPELVQEGRRVFMTLQCWTCHGTQGRGDGKAAKTLIDNWGQPVRPINFTWAQYKRGKDPVSLYKTINTGLNGTPMVPFGSSFLFGGDRTVDSLTLASFSKQEVSALSEYLASQPKEADIGAMSEERKQEVDQRRKWALVHYIRSLSRKPNVLQWLFAEDMELTR